MSNSAKPPIDNGHQRNPAPGISQSWLKRCPVPEFDSYKERVKLPAGATTFAGPEPVKTLIYSFSGAFGAGTFTGGIGIPSGALAKPVLWRFEPVFASEGWNKINAQSNPAIQYVGTQLQAVPIMLPCKLYLIPLDQAAAVDSLTVAWRIQPESSFSDSIEEVPRVLPQAETSLVTAGSFYPASSSSLLMPLGASLEPGLVTQRRSGFGWRPTQVTVRKEDPADDVLVYAATGGGVIPPIFGCAEMPVGVSQITMPVDPGWGGGLRIKNNGNGALAGALSFVWQRI